MAHASMTVDLRADDYAAFVQRAHQQPAVRRQRWARHKRFAVITVIGLAALLLSRAWNGGDVAWAPFLRDFALAVVLGLGALALLVLGFERLLPVLIRANVRRLLRQQADQPFLGVHRLAFGPDGIDDTTDSASGRVPWEAVSRVEESADHLYVMLGGAQGVIVPKRGQSEAVLAEVRAVLRQHVADASLVGA
ncbi:YcxB family protein [Bordetella genomosp. 13]|uniref:YcxB family protein n=1 Tax=Bordetella genomosp. 13 TaxID=463040 RepID=UPI00119E1AB2|nr:YcxB family protein [Bordetella genomosp. 13]